MAHLPSPAASTAWKTPMPDLPAAWKTTSAPPSYIAVAAALPPEVFSYAGLGVALVLGQVGGVDLDLRVDRLHTRLVAGLERA